MVGSTAAGAASSGPGGPAGCASGDGTGWGGAGSAGAGATSAAGLTAVPAGAAGVGATSGAGAGAGCSGAGWPVGAGSPASGVGGAPSVKPEPMAANAGTKPASAAGADTPAAQQQRKHNGRVVKSRDARDRPYRVHTASFGDSWGAAVGWETCMGWETIPDHAVPARRVELLDIDIRTSS